MLKRAPWLLVVMLIAGCGFKLRGSVPMPPWLNHIAIVSQTSAHRDLIPMLKDQLQAYNLIIDTDPTKARYLLIIEKDLSQQIITSISSSTTPRQYQLLYTVQYSLIKAKGQPIVSSNSVTITRQLTVNNDRILGSDSEGMTIHREMHRDAVMQIINRLSKKSAAVPVAQVSGVP